MKIAESGMADAKAGMAHKEAGNMNMVKKGTGEKGFFLTLDVAVALMLMLLVIAIVYYYYAAAKPETISGALVHDYMQDTATVLVKQGYLADPLLSQNNSNTSGIRSVLSATPASVCMQVVAYGTSVPDGLIGYWKFDEGSGMSASDSTGSGNSGTLKGGAQFSTGGKSQGAIKFDGSSGYVLMADNVSIRTPAVSVSAWIKPMSTPTGTWTLVRLANGYELSLDDSNPIFQFWDGSNWMAMTCGDTLSTGEWHHIAGVLDANGIGGIFLDSVPCGGMASTSPLSHGSGPFTISSTTSSEVPDAYMDDVRIYDRALLWPEVQELYSNPRGIEYVVDKPECPYSGGEIYALSVPFSRMVGQEEKQYRAELTSWLKGERSEPLRCTPDGYYAINASACCSKILNKNSVCGAACIVVNQPCGATPNCCSGVCSGGLCGPYSVGCIANGSSGCIHNYECCDGLCNSFGGCSCLGNTSSCSNNSDCCTGLICRKATNQCRECIADGSSATYAVDCCSGMLDSFGKCGCNANATSCNKDTDCCSGVCNSYYKTCGCRANATPCNYGSDCCTGFCNLTTNYTTNITTGLCDICGGGLLPDNASCVWDFDCCSGNCKIGLDATCGCVRDAIPCNISLDCPGEGLTGWTCSSYGDCGLPNNVPNYNLPVNDSNYNPCLYRGQHYCIGTYGSSGTTSCGSDQDCCSGRCVINLLVCGVCNHDGENISAPPGNGWCCSLTGNSHGTCGHLPLNSTCVISDECIGYPFSVTCKQNSTGAYVCSNCQESLTGNCTYGSDCCSGICSSGKCTCHYDFQFCNNNSDCCSGRCNILSNTCTYSPLYTACNDSNQCWGYVGIRHGSTTACFPSNPLISPNGYCCPYGSYCWPLGRIVPFY